MTLTVYVGGVFDHFHNGHKELFKDIQTLCGFSINLIVAVNSDSFVEHYRERVPEGLQDEKTRVRNVKDFVEDNFLHSKVFLMRKHEDQKKHLLDYKVDAVYHGTDWLEDSLYRQFGVTKEGLQKNKIIFFYTDRRTGKSSAEERPLCSKCHGKGVCPG